MLRTEGVTVRQNPPTGVSQALSAVAFPQLRQAWHRLCSLAPGLARRSEVLYYFLRHGPHRHGPAAEIRSIVRQILLVRQRHMLQIYQWITLDRLQAAVAGNTAAVAKHLHRGLCDTDIYFSPIRLA